MSTSQPRHKVVIESQFRDTTLFPNPARFRVSLAAPLSDIRSISLGNCRIPLDNTIPPSTRPSYVAICLEEVPIGFGDLVQQVEMPPFTGNVLGYIFLNDTLASTHYAYTSGEPVWCSSTRMALPRLQSFVISLQYYDKTTETTALYPMPNFVPGGPNWDWFATIVFNCSPQTAARSSPLSSPASFSFL